MLLAAATLAGCAPEVAEEETSTVRSHLYLDGNLWRTNDAGVHVVPVCFDAAAVADPAYESVRERVRTVANTTWGAVANIVFTEFAPCTNNFEHLEVTIWSSPGGQTDGRGIQINGVRRLRLNANSDQGNIAHELGHALGFRHEFDRPDFINDSSGGCQAEKVGGKNTLGTAANDRASIMTYSYCDDSTGTLSLWDIIGVQAAYGRKRGGSVVVSGNRCLGVPDIANQAVATVYGCYGDIGQRWKHETNDSLSVTMGWVTKCLDVPAANNADGTSPTLYDCHGGTNQKWALQNVAIRGLAGQCLEREHGSLENGTRVRLGRCHKWTFTSDGEIRTNDGGPGSKCIDLQQNIAANGQPLTLYECHGGPNQKFTMQGGQLRVRGMCMDVETGSPNEGTPVSVYQCGSSTKLNQQWNTWGPLVSLGKCLQLPAGDTSNGTHPALGSCLGLGVPGQDWEYYWP